MPKKSEKVFPVPVSEETDIALRRLVETTGLRQTDILRYAITAALQTLAEKDSISMPIHFSVNGEAKKGK